MGGGLSDITSPLWPSDPGHAALSNAILTPTHWHHPKSLSVPIDQNNEPSGAVALNDQLDPHSQSSIPFRSISIVKLQTNFSHVVLPPVADLQ